MIRRSETNYRPAARSLHNPTRRTAISRLAISAVLLAGFGCSVTVIPPTSPAEQLDYRHWAEGLLVMALQGAASDRMKLYSLGESSTAGIDQYAMKISLDAEQEDGGEKNAVLIECGMHAREWFAAESCYWLIDWFVENLETPEVDELLAEVDVWVVPQTNPAGRDLDDPGLGDPTAFVNVCRDGANEGDPCVTNTDCDSNDCYGTGWRTNANTSTCAAGVDLARNWSRGWNSAAVCDPSEFMKFRGTAPFSESETRNLRRFVHNHMISMVLIAHTTTQDVWNLWANTSDANSFMVDELVALNANGLGSDTEAAMVRDSVGSGVGQFSGWLTSASNVAGELDDTTERNISTFFFEMPISGSFYYSDDYDGDDYQFAASDGSNTFHPSSTVWYRLWEDSILPMMQYVIRQAGSPQCPLDDSGGRVTTECESDSFGLVGMKIAPALDEPGALDHDPATREETLLAGTYDIVYAAQNFSTGGGTTKDAEVRVFEDGSLVATYSDAISLTVGSRASYAHSHAFQGGHDYRVEVELDSDDFSNDNEKSMAFRVDAIPAPTPFPFPRNLWFLEDLILHPEKGDLLVVEGRTARLLEPRIGPEPIEVSWTTARPRDGRSREARTHRTATIPRRGVKVHDGTVTHRALDPRSSVRELTIEADREGPGSRVRIVLRDPELSNAHGRALTTSLRIHLDPRTTLEGHAIERSNVPKPYRRTRSDDPEDGTKH